MAKIEDLDIIEFENVLNEKLVQDLRRLGYIYRDESTPFGSLFKVVR